MGIMGATSGGNLTNLIALGAMDTHLTMCPSITYWRFRYNRYTNFTLESMEQTFDSPVAFGNDCRVTLNRNGDLVYFCYAVITVPGIMAVDDTGNTFGFGITRFPVSDACDPAGDGVQPDPTSSAPAPAPVAVDDSEGACTGIDVPYCHYVNALGQFLVKRASIIIGGHVIDTLCNDFLYMWEELSGKPGKRLTEMIGKRYTRSHLVLDSKQTRTLYVPLPFWFTQCSGNTLPICSLQFHGIQMLITFESLQNCIQVSSDKVRVLKVEDESPITANDLKARIDTTYVYLDMDERDLFATGCFEQLITQVQSLYQPSMGGQLRMALNFNHPVIELIFAVRRDKNTALNSKKSTQAQQRKQGMSECIKCEIERVLTMFVSSLCLCSIVQTTSTTVASGLWTPSRKCSCSSTTPHALRSVKASGSVWCNRSSTTPTSRRRSCTTTRSRCILRSRSRLDPATSRVSTRWL
jgi:hypothetical protein